MYHRHHKEKRGHWSPTKLIISVDLSAGMITVPGDGKDETWTVAFKCVRLASPLPDFAQLVTDLINDLDSVI